MQQRPPPLLAILIGALCLAAAFPAAAMGAGGSAPPPPRQMLRQYFADLNAHRLHAAWLLEAPCGASYTVSNGPGAPVGSVGFAGRGAWVAPRGVNAKHPILAAAHVTAIRQLHIPEFARNHIQAFGVSGQFRFDYTVVPWANDTHRSGFHVVKIAMWRCNGRWGIEPSYWEVSGGGPLSWN